MAKLVSASFFLLLLSLSSVCNLGLAAQYKGSSWCIAKPLTPEGHLKENIKFACGDGGVKCEQIYGKGRPCYTDDTLSRASLAMNAYYQKQNKKEGTCAFTNPQKVPSGIVVTNDPNYDKKSNCFPSS